MDKKSDEYLKYLAYLKSSLWISIKLDLIQMRGCKCELCEDVRTINILNIHHITYKNLYNEFTEDLIILCPKCHMYQHGLLKVKKIKIIKKLQKVKRKIVVKKKNKYNLTTRDKELQKRYDKLKN